MRTGAGIGIAIALLSDPVGALVVLGSYYHDDDETILWHIDDDETLVLESGD